VHTHQQAGGRRGGEHIREQVAGIRGGELREALRVARPACGRASPHANKPTRTHIAQSAVARMTGTGEMSRGGGAWSGGACKKRAYERGESASDGLTVVAGVPPRAGDDARESAEGTGARGRRSRAKGAVAVPRPADMLRAGP
jgi:hypothetical protein